MIFESHAHYEDHKFDGDRERLLSSMAEHGIGTIVNVGSTIETSRESIALAEAYEAVYAAIGVHPSNIAELDDEGILWLKQQASHPKAVAIGEIGLDYYWDKEESVQENQRYWFARQLELAAQVNLPAIIHSREAAEDTMRILKEFCRKYPAISMPGVIHCYSYSPEMAQEFIKMGFYIGVGGVVTFKNAKKLKETVTKIPLERILVETDCPYMAPEPHRGERNSSLYLPYVIEKIAELKGSSLEEVKNVTERNARKMYGIETTSGSGEKGGEADHECI